MKEGILGCVVALVLVAGFAIADRSWLHWYVPDERVSAYEEIEDDLYAYLNRLDGRVDDLEFRASDIESQLFDAQGDIDDVADCVNDLEVEVYNDVQEYIYGYSTGRCSP